MPIDGKIIVKQYDDLKSARSNRDSTLQIAAPFIDPSRGQASASEVVEGQPWMTEVFDSHAISVADLSAYYIQGQSTSQGKKWFNLRERQEWLNEEDEVKEWLESCRDKMMAQIDRSNFYQSDLQIKKDYWSWGPGGGLIEERQFLNYRPQAGYRGLHLSHDMVGRFVAGWDTWGKVNRYGVERMWTAAAAVERFGEKNVSEKVKGAFEKSPEQKFKFIHFISPRGNSEYGEVAKQKTPWKWCWVEYDSKHVCEEGGYRKMRGLVPRQGGLFGEDYGRGRADIAINDVWTKNSAKRLELESAALHTRPVTWTRSGMLAGMQNLVPGSFLVANWNSQRPLSDGFHSWGGDGDLQWSQVEQEQLKRSISEVYFVDHLRQAIALQGNHQQTAFERAQMEREILKLIGPVYAPYTFGFTDPFIDLMFDDMLYAGEFDDPPEILVNEGGQIDVVYDSPLTAVQAIDEVQAMEEWEERFYLHADAHFKATGKPSPAWDMIDWVEWQRVKAGKKKVPSGPILSAREVAMIQDSKAQAERNQMVNQELAGGAEALGKVAPFLKVMQGGKEGKAA